MSGIQNTDKTNILFKKFQGYANTDNSVLNEFQENARPYSSLNRLYSKDIPSTAPTSLSDTTITNNYKKSVSATTESISYTRSVPTDSNQSYIVKYSNVPLYGFSGQTDRAFYYNDLNGTTNILKNAIPANYDSTNGSYNYTVYLNNGTTVVSKDNYSFDTDAGLITFYNYLSVSQASPPKVTFWRYEGPVGIPNWSTIKASETVDVSGNRITGLADPTGDTDAVSKAYLVSQIGSVTSSVTPSSWSSYPATTNVDLSGNRILRLAEPTDASGAATKNYVDVSLNTINTRITGLSTTVSSTTTSLNTQASRFKIYGNSAIKINDSGDSVNQGNYSITIGKWAGSSNQGSNAIGIGANSGNSSQGIYAIAIGESAGKTSQGEHSVGIGTSSGLFNQGLNSIAIGKDSAKNYQDMSGIAIGSYAGYTSQKTLAIAIGTNAGYNSQQSNAIALGNMAGSNRQGIFSIAIGDNAGQTSQGGYSVALGDNAGQISQRSNAVAIGFNAGSNVQGENAIAIGQNAGQTSQSANTIVLNATGSAINGSIGTSRTYIAPIRNDASNNTLTTNPLYYDPSSYELVQGPSWSRIQAVSDISMNGFRINNLQEPIDASGAATKYYVDFSLNTLSTTVSSNILSSVSNWSTFKATSNVDMSNNRITNLQEPIDASGAATKNYVDSSFNTFIINPTSIKIGSNAGKVSQSINTVAIGRNAGSNTQRSNAVAIGLNAGSNTQGSNAVAIGINAGTITQSSGAVSIGESAGNNNQGLRAIAIGVQAGMTSQGLNAIAIGQGAGETSQVANSIAINAQTGTPLNPATSGFFVAPVRDLSNVLTNTPLYYTSSNEIVRGPSWSQVKATGNVDMSSNRIINLVDPSGIQDAATKNYVDTSLTTLSTTVSGLSSTAVSNWAQYGANCNVNMQSNSIYNLTNPTLDTDAANKVYVDNKFKTSSIQLGSNTGSISQQASAIAIGSNAGSNTQGSQSVAIGLRAGEVFQQRQSIAIGVVAGGTSQGSNAVAIGFNAGFNTQKSNAIAIGYNAGSNNQGSNAIAIGFNAGSNNQLPNSIIINASSSNLNISTTNPGLFIDPIRDGSTNISDSILPLCYNAVTKEIAYNKVWNRLQPPDNMVTPSLNLTSANISLALNDTYNSSIYKLDNWMHKYLLGPAPKIDVSSNRITTSTELIMQWTLPEQIQATFTTKKLPAIDSLVADISGVGLGIIQNAVNITTNLPDSSNPVKALILSKNSGTSGYEQRTIAGVPSPVNAYVYYNTSLSSASSVIFVNISYRNANGTSAVTQVSLSAFTTAFPPSTIQNLSVISYTTSAIKYEWTQPQYVLYDTDVSANSLRITDNGAPSFSGYRFTYAVPATKKYNTSISTSPNDIIYISSNKQTFEKTGLVAGTTYQIIGSAKNSLTTLYGPTNTITRETAIPTIESTRFITNAGLAFDNNLIGTQYTRTVDGSTSVNIRSTASTDTTITQPIFYSLTGSMSGSAVQLAVHDTATAGATTATLHVMKLAWDASNSLTVNGWNANVKAVSNVSISGTITSSSVTTLASTIEDNFQGDSTNDKLVLRVSVPITLSWAGQAAGTTLYTKTLTQTIGSATYTYTLPYYVDDLLTTTRASITPTPTFTISHASKKICGITIYGTAASNNITMSSITVTNAGRYFYYRDRIFKVSVGSPFNTSTTFNPTLTLTGGAGTAIQSPQTFSSHNVSTQFITQNPNSSRYTKGISYTITPYNINGDGLVRRNER
jgi:hypothetical protein